tara:strand:- start:45 stop:2768 length:2724 start_codon:yes stop_codon:yes gene_type:complete
MPDIQISSSDELSTGVSLTPANFHNLINNATVQSGVIGDKTASATMEASDELLLKQSSSGALRKVTWANLASEVSADFALSADSVDETKSDFYVNWEDGSAGASGETKDRLVTDGFLPVAKLATSTHPVIDVMAYGALGDNTGTVVAQWLTGGTHTRGYTNLAGIQADYPWVESLFDTIDFAACQKALDVAWQLTKATYGKAENSAGGLLAQSSSDNELTKSGTARSVTVYFPTGWYKTNKTLIAPPRVTIKGDGGKHTTIRYTGDRYDNAGVRKTSGYTDSITIGGTAYTLARVLDDKKWKYYNDNANYKLPKRRDGMHAIMLVRDNLPYTHATVTLGLYNGVATVTSTQGSTPASASFLVNQASATAALPDGGYADTASSIVYDGGSSISASILHFEGGGSYTSTNSLAASGTATGGALDVLESGYFQENVINNEKFYQQATLTVATSHPRIYPYTRIKFQSGVFVVTADAAINASTLTGYVESGTISNTHVGTIDIYSQGFNPAGAEQDGDESLSAAKDRVHDYDGEISGIQFSSLAWDYSVGLWLPGFQHDNVRYTDLIFKGYGSFDKDSHITETTPRMSTKGMVGCMLNNGSNNLARCYGKNLHWSNCTFEACYVGLMFATGKGCRVDGNQMWDNRFSVRMGGLYHTICDNRIDNFSGEDMGGAFDYIPFAVGECAIYLRLPVCCVISANTIHQTQRAIELYGCTGVSISGNTIAVPDPAGRNAAHDYTQAHGFVLMAGAAGQGYSYADEGQAMQHNAGLMVTGNSWMYTNYKHATYSPIWIEHDATVGVHRSITGRAICNGHEPLGFTDATCDTTHTGGSTTTVNCDSTTKIAAGQRVTGAGIAAGVTVSSISGSTAFVISSAATATASNVTLTFWYPTVKETQDDDAVQDRGTFGDDDPS